MKKATIYLPFIAMVILALTFTSCKKETSKNVDNSKNAEDANGVSNTVDANSDDVTAMAGQVSSFSGKTNGLAAYYMLCGSTTIDTGSSTTRKVTITYDGTTVCNGVIRSGTVTITPVGTSLWQQQGAQVSVLISNVKVTDISTGNSFTLNGTHTITNETGGLAWELFWNPSLVPNETVKHRDQSSNMTVAFSDGSTGTWNVDRTRTWSASGSVVTVSVNTESNNDEDTWGTNRYGQSFNTTIPTAIMANDNNAACAWRPYQGKYVYTDAAGNASIQFGTNSSGVAVGTATTATCGIGVSTYGYYLTYTLSAYNYNLNLFLPYSW